MPELPEVETIKRQLAPKIEGRQINRATVHDPRLCEPSPPRQFERGLKGLRILGEKPGRSRPGWIARRYAE